MTWLLAVYDPFTSKISHRRVDGGDADGLIALLGRCRRDIQQRAGAPVGIECVFEAGYDGFWLQRRLAQAEIAGRIGSKRTLLTRRAYCERFRRGCAVIGKRVRLFACLMSRRMPVDLIASSRG
jgi:hypothetical protein